MNNVFIIRFLFVCFILSSINNIDTNAKPQAKTSNLPRYLN